MSNSTYFNGFADPSIETCSLAIDLQSSFYTAHYGGAELNNESAPGALPVHDRTLC